MNDLAEQLLRSEFRKLMGTVMGGGSGGGIGDFIGGLLKKLPGFANGGFLPAGQIGIVGEKGPELIQGPANITPMNGFGNVTYNINAVDAPSFQALVARDPAFIHGVAMQGAKSI